LGLLAKGAAGEGEGEGEGGEGGRGNGEKRGFVTEAGFEMLAAGVADGFALKTGAFIDFF